MKLKAKQEIKLGAITKYLCGELHYTDAIAALELKERQFRRVIKAFREDGVASFSHGNCGRPPPNKLSFKDRNHIIHLYQTRYNGLNLVHFRERLATEIKIVPSYSTIRNILQKEGLLKAEQKRGKRVHYMRKRYEKEGMMVQIDGSHHRWIWGLIPCCLTLAIDDATGKLLAGKFSRTETTFDAMDVVEEIFKRHGLFQILYSDRAGIYGGGKRDGYSNMNRAMKELGILSIQAQTPQAKGRIERSFRTLQDRLVSEFRLNKIHTIEEANKYLADFFIPEFNKKFGVVAESKEVAFRKLTDDYDLGEILTIRENRVVQKGEFISYQSKRLVITTKFERSLERSIIEIREYRSGAMKIFYQNKELTFMALDNEQKAA